MNTDNNAKTLYSGGIETYGIRVNTTFEGIDQKKRLNEYLIYIITDITLFISVCACISGLWSDISIFLICFIGVPVLFLRLLQIKNVKIFTIAWFAGVGAVLVAMIILHPSFFGGLKLLGNELFDIAESKQGYIYDRFEDTQGIAYGTRLISCGILSTFFAFGLLWARYILSRIFTALGLFVFTVYICSYLGIAPSYIAIMGIIISPVLFFLFKSKMTLKAFLVTAGITAAIMAGVGLITAAVTPEKNFEVSQTEEKLRDLLAGKTVHFANMISDEEDADNDKNGSDDEDGADDDPMLDEAQPPGETGGSINGVTLLFIILAIIVILLILFIPAILFDKVKKRREKNMQGIDSEDNATAITSLFIYLMRWFKYKGWCKDNQFFEDTIPAIKNGMSEEYSEKFEEMRIIWQEAAFSDKDQTDENKLKMESFVNDTIAYLWDQADFKERMKIRYKYALK